MVFGFGNFFFDGGKFVVLEVWGVVILMLRLSVISDVWVFCIVDRSMDMFWFWCSYLFFIVSEWFDIGVDLV